MAISQAPAATIKGTALKFSHPGQKKRYPDSNRLSKMYGGPGLNAQVRSLSKLYLPLSQQDSMLNSRPGTSNGMKEPGPIVAEALRAYADTDNSSYFKPSGFRSRNHALTTKGTSHSKATTVTNHIDDVTLRTAASYQNPRKYPNQRSSAIEVAR